MMRIASLSSLSAMFTSVLAASASRLKVVTWNVAAINNNPFEYWVSYPNPAYNTLMASVERFIQNPGADDVAVKKIFPWYDDLERLMLASGLVSAADAAQVREIWDKDISQRAIVTGFLKDGQLGKKRFASMPDRITNTIVRASGTLYRPTAINCYPGRFASLEDWWAQWREFMFSQPVRPGVTVVQLLKPIPRAKYPALSETEERLSVGLQIVYQAVFDAIIIHMLSVVGTDSAGNDVWQRIRSDIAQALNRDKPSKVAGILRAQYGDADIVFLQEVANGFDAELARAGVLDAYDAVFPASARARDQNSAILLRKGVFANAREVSVAAFLPADAPLDDGDLLVVRAEDSKGRPFMLASFHGDTDGLATPAVVRAVHAAAHAAEASSDGAPVLLFGLDANAYEAPAGKQLAVGEFKALAAELGMTHCFERARAHLTTFNARTYLQPQLNKAAGKAELRSKGDVNPKDYVLGYAAQVAFVHDSVARDNTGRGVYLEDTVFPSLEFPSDHGIVCAHVDVLERAKSEL